MNVDGRKVNTATKIEKDGGGKNDKRRERAADRKQEMEVKRKCAEIALPMHTAGYIQKCVCVRPCGGREGVCVCVCYTPVSCTGAVFHHSTSSVTQLVTHTDTSAQSKSFCHIG